LSSTKILRAMRDAVKRGVTVQAVLDRVNIRKKIASALYLHLAGASVWIDTTVKIAHSKLILIDDEAIIGGSFNYSKAAQSSNAENVTFIYSAELAGQFNENWDSRVAVATPFVP